MSQTQAQAVGDPDTGKLFEVPRAKVIVDLTDPTVLKLAFSGAVDLDRGNAKQVDFYNKLRAGDPAEMVVSVHVAGAKQIHRRDGEGDVDAIVQTKSLIVSDVDLIGVDDEVTEVREGA